MSSQDSQIISLSRIKIVMTPPTTPAEEGKIAHLLLKRVPILDVAWEAIEGGERSIHVDAMLGCVSSHESFWRGKGLQSLSLVRSQAQTVLLRGSLSAI